MSTQSRSAPLPGPLSGLFAPARVQATVIQIATVAMFLLACLTVDNYATASNIASILYAASTVGIAAVGLASVTISGNLFALSLGSTAAFASIIYIQLSGLGVIGALLGSLALGVVFGLIQGIVVGLLRCNAIITTIAASSLIAGLATAFSGGRTVLATGGPSWLGNGAILPGIPWQAVIFLVVVVVAELLLQRSRTGWELRLRGTNPAAAELAGLRTRRVVVLSYVLAGAGAAMAGALIAAQSGTGNMRVGADLDFSAIAAMLVGGVAISGGRGRIIDVAAGTLFLAVLTNILLVNNFAYEVQLMIKGLAVLVAVTAGALLSRKKR
ncbi:ABC transporter permease [Pseudooceanicola sp. CBS1P-1]|uniref:ABC transporter permease n=1 Tax=Pseudooceanicola albus TaxID=2692189 RepID=A0A6L7G035_9RHOB|nr:MULTISPECIES: ABC transporter permease [Pseudooceanicola]MBT9383570.1 ABC transporter permease [Pseudooceanicola endophyticus]MXN17425.1 ABC transporter permease [Pseudooceanicola albus]